MVIVAFFKNLLIQQLVLVFNVKLYLLFRIIDMKAFKISLLITPFGMSILYQSCRKDTTPYSPIEEKLSGESKPLDQLGAKDGY